MKNKLLKEFREEFDKMTYDEKIMMAFQMSEQLFEIDNYIHSREFFENFENNGNAYNVMRKIHSILGIYIEEDDI